MRRVRKLANVVTWRISFCFLENICCCSDITISTTFVSRIRVWQNNSNRFQPCIRRSLERGSVLTLCLAMTYWIPHVRRFNTDNHAIFEHCVCYKLNRFEDMSRVPLITWLSSLAHHVFRMWAIRCDFSSSVTLWELMNSEYANHSARGRTHGSEACVGYPKLLCGTIQHNCAFRFCRRHAKFVGMNSTWECVIQLDRCDALR